MNLACAQVDGSTSPPTLPGCEKKLDRAASTLATDTICAANASGQLIASALVTLDLHLKQECRAFLEGTVHPDYRARGLGDFILNWMQARSRQAFAAITDHRPRVLRIDVYDKRDDAIALYKRHGFRFALAEDEMRRDLNDPVPTNALPSGMTFFNWSPQNAGLFFKVYEEAFRDRPGFPGWNEETWRHALTGQNEFRADLSLLATEGNEPVAFAVCAVESDEGWIVQIGVRPAWRKRGLAGVVLSELLRRFKTEGLHYALLEVSIDNPQAASVYQRLGFVHTKRFTSFQKRIRKQPR